MHYLQDRFLHPGQWNDTPIYQDCRLTWFDEGMAEFLVGSTQDEGIRVRRIVVKNIDSWGTSHHFNPTQIFNSCYWDGWDFYTYGGLFFNFAHEQRRTELLALLDEVRSGDTTAYDTRIKKWKDDTTLADDYDAFLDTQVSELKKGHLVDPTTTFPALGTLTTKSPTEIENALREIDSELNPVCDIAATKHNPRFECTDIVSASSGFSGDRGATNAHLSEQLDDLIVAAVDHKGGTINNFETMNCYFTDVDGSPPDANFSCEGPLAFEPGVTLSQTSLGVAENGGTGSYTLKLITQPTGNVTVTVSGEAGGALVHTAGGTPAATTTLTFTPDTYATEQTVTVTGVDDALVTPVDRTVTLTHTAVGGDYDSVATNNTVTVTLIDDEVTYCSPTPHNPQVARKYGRIDRVVFGAIDHFTGANADYSTYDTEAVVTPGSSVNLKVTVRSPSPSGNDWDPHTIYAWIDWNEDGEFASSERVVDEAIVSLRTDSAQTVTQSVAIPATVEPGQKRMRVRLTYWSYSGELGPCDNYWIGEIEDYNNIRVGVVEPGFRFSRTSLSVAENGGTGSYILALRTEPTGPVTVTVSGEAGGALVSTVGGTPAATTQLTFTPSNYDLAQTVLVTGVDDAVVNPADRTATLTHTAVGGGYDSVSSHNTVTVTLIDDDDGVLTLTLHLDSSSISENGGSSTVTATLSHPSSEAVSVTVSAPASDAYSLSANSTLSIAAGQTISTGTVTLTAIDNALDAPDTQVTLSGTASGGNGVAHPASVTLTITDDDAVSVSIGVAPGTKVAYTDTVTLTAQVSDPAQVASYRWAHVGGYHKISTQQAVTLGGAKWPNSPGTRTFEVYVTLTDGSEVTARQSITFTKP